MNYEKLDKIVESYRDELIANIQKWVSVPSVQGAPAGENAPFGVEVRRMLDMALADAKAFGFEVRDIDGYAGDVSYGAGPETMGMLCHLDVVPEGTGWQYPPYGAEIHDEAMYGRGTADAADGCSLLSLLRRPQIHYGDLAPFDPNRPALPADVCEQVEISVKYEGYIRRQEQQVKQFNWSGYKFREDLSSDTKYVFVTSFHE